MKRILLVLFLCSNCWPGVIAQWKMNDNALSTTVVDSIGPHNGTFKDATGDPNTSAQNASGRINGALDFDGTDDYVEIADHAAFSPVLKPFSISAWVYMHDATSFVIASKGVYNTDAEWEFLIDFNDKLGLVIFDESVDNCYISRTYNTTLTSYQNSWINVVGTYGGGTTYTSSNLYLNGVSVADAGADAGVFVAVENLNHAVWVGRYDPDYADGLIDNVVIFDKELTALEVRRLYNGGAGTEYVGRTNLRTRYTSGYGFNYRNRYKF